MLPFGILSIVLVLVAIFISLESERREKLFDHILSSKQKIAITALAFLAIGSLFIPSITPALQKFGHDWKDFMSIVVPFITFPFTVVASALGIFIGNRLRDRFVTTQETANVLINLLREQCLNLLDLEHKMKEYLKTSQLTQVLGASPKEDLLQPQREKMSIPLNLLKEKQFLSQSDILKEISNLSDGEREYLSLYASNISRIVINIEKWTFPRVTSSPDIIPAIHGICNQILITEMIGVFCYLKLISVYQKVKLKSERDFYEDNYRKSKLVETIKNTLPSLQEDSRKEILGELVQIQEWCSGEPKIRKAFEPVLSSLIELIKDAN